jgi:hypothetical protein
MDNIFNFATSELSQDAFLAYLISASKKGSSQPMQDYKISQIFLKSFLSTNGKVEISDIRLQEDAKYIDPITGNKIKGRIDLVIEGIYCKKTFILVIEDKTQTSQHDNQLERYRNYIDIRYPNHEKHFIYFKSDVEGEIEYVNSANYKFFTINEIVDLIALSEMDKSTNTIFVEWRISILNRYSYLKRYENIPVKDWMNSENKGIWKGFFYYIQNKYPQFRLHSGYFDLHGNNHWGLWLHGHGNHHGIQKYLGEYAVGMTFDSGTEDSNSDRIFIGTIRASELHDDDKNITKLYPNKVINFSVPGYPSKRKRAPSVNLVLSETVELTKSTISPTYNFKDLEKQIVNIINIFIKYPITFQYSKNI